MGEEEEFIIGGVGEDSESGEVITRKLNSTPEECQFFQEHDPISGIVQNRPYRKLFENDVYLADVLEQQYGVVVELTHPTMYDSWVMDPRDVTRLNVPIFELMENDKALLFGARLAGFKAEADLAEVLVYTSGDDLGFWTDNRPLRGLLANDLTIAALMGITF